MFKCKILCVIHNKLCPSLNPYPGQPGSGSPLFYINSWAMIWPTDYPAAARWRIKGLVWAGCTLLCLSMLFQSLQWIRHSFHALMAAQDRYIQIHTFLYLLCIRLYPLQRMHILNQYTYMIHTDTYRYIQYIRYELIYLTCILPVFLYVSCMYLVYICMYCMYLSVFSAAKFVSRINTYNTYIYIHICTRYIQICIPIHTKYIQNTCTYIQSLPVICCVHICFWADLSCMYLYVCAYHVHMLHVSLGEFIFQCIGMYEHVCVSICLYVCISTIQTYRYICVCICMYCLYMHVLYVSLSYPYNINLYCVYLPRPAFKRQ